MLSNYQFVRYDPAPWCQIMKLLKTYYFSYISAVGWLLR